jgi:MSHA biogenesis protein MshK
MIRFVLAVLALGGASAAWGQALTDPTRPPQAWLDAQPKTAGAPAAPEQEPAPQLQSLLISGSRKYAIIEGQVVKAGDTVKGFRVVAVGPAGVVLRSEHETQTLKLFPDVDKHPAKTVTPAPAKAKRRISLSGPDQSVAKEKK